MNDIFISYDSEDRERILPLVSALEKSGWSLFWDRTIPTGKTWRVFIGTEIESCRHRNIPSIWQKKSKLSWNKSLRIQQQRSRLSDARGLFCWRARA